jgi:hypothetical protein
MNKQEVIDLMRSSKNSTEWRTNCDLVKNAHSNNYPSYWYSEIISSGLCDEILGKGSSEIKIVSGKDALNFLENPL